MYQKNNENDKNFTVMSHFVKYDKKYFFIFNGFILY